MIVYFALLLVVTLVVYISQRMEDRVGSFLMQTFAFVSLVLVTGLRSGDVGSDSLSYIRRFEDISELADEAWRELRDNRVPIRLGDLAYYTGAKHGSVGAAIRAIRRLRNSLRQSQA